MCKESTCEARKNVFYFTSKALVVLNGIKVRVFFEKNIEKSTCAVMIRIIITFARWESFLPITDNFLAFFIVFEWGRILEGAMDK